MRGGGGLHGRRNVWWGACVAGEGVRGERGVCVAGHVTRVKGNIARPLKSHLEDKKNLF